MTIATLTQEFSTIFNRQDTPRRFFAPGRINLIGEHTDYNGGHVFPASISFGTYAITQTRTDKKIRFYSLNKAHTGVIECDIDNLAYDTAHDWANYPKGMMKYIQESGFHLSTGLDILFYGDIPNGAGLSSSASIEMVTGIALDGLFNLGMDRIKMIQLGQKVENDYIGVNSGIMDQFAIGKGKENHAILLDCQTLKYKYAPIQLDNHAIIIINTNKQRTLASSKYNERRAQCEQALADLQTEHAIESLGQLTSEQFEESKHLITDDINRKRAQHAVYENTRTLEALQQLQQGHLDQFGLLMNASHQSLQFDYEVTGIELDTLVEAAWKQPGVVGARMTGAGFGGCAIAIVENEYVEAFKENVNAIYSEKIGYDATFYTASIGDGARELTEECIG